ncbi:MAG: putative selenium-dependent hydroxylase accessory protein YqeC [Actinobacteria bacterium]|nr:putative selenium-dependent hydroxylase accessory protein YqeC [Actinomycetota bacterium]
MSAETHDMAAFVGAGGKSSAIQTIASELSEAGMTVLAVPTTKMFVNEAEKIGPLVTSEDAGELRAKVEELLSGGAPGVVVGSGLLSKNRLGGVEPAVVSSLASLADVVLVEADGSRRRPIKGTAEYEPPLPDAATLVVAVGNIGAFGMPVDEEHVHRPEVFSELTGIGSGQSITARAFALALARGSLASIPDGARPAALITSVHPGKSMADASVVTRELWRLGIEKVVLSSLPEESPGRVWVP